MAFAQAPPPPAPVYNWTGWYAGFNFGGGFGTSNNATTTSTDDFAKFFPGTTPSGSIAGANSGVAGLNQSGPIGGVQFGYNFQLNPLFAFGFEADIQGAAITSDRAGNTGTSTESFAGTSSYFKSVTIPNTSAEALAASFTNAAITASGFNLVTADLNWLGTARIRAGYLITPNLLLYATGGLAYGGVSASDSATLNFGNLTADSFAVGYSQTIGPKPVVTVSATAGPNPSASTTAQTDGAVASIAGGGPNCSVLQHSNSVCTASIVSFTGAVAAAASGSTTSGNTTLAAAAIGTLTNVAAIANAFTPTQSALSYTQATKNLSVALATTTQSFARVSDTKFGGTVGGGLEWMMAPNWSVKAEALYYDLGSVTVTQSTSSINPIAAAASAGLTPIAAQSPPGSTLAAAAATAAAAINKFTGAATVSNATRVTFQGVIIRLGLNYHFNLL